MSSHICGVVPPYLLQGIAEGRDGVDDDGREAALRSLKHRHEYTSRRCDRLAALSQPRARQQHAALHQQQSIVPEILLQHIAEAEGVDEETRQRARRDCEQIKLVTTAYKQSLSGEGGVEQQSLAPKLETDGFYRAVYDAKHAQNENKLPGTVVRVEGQKVANDEAVNQAYDNVGKVLDFYEKFFKWKSIDNKNMHVLSSVHFGKGYENAFWDPDRMQMVFGDGHTFLYHFTNCIDVIGHELTHAVTEHTSPLEYEGQAGALNEHISDVFGIMVKQLVEDETADKADWLIGEGCLLPDVKGVALRSMKEPGTAYDDPRFGKDPQPASMAGYKPVTEDNGGVHMFSGIPNRAFYLASAAFGGYSWEKAGQIWWKTMNSGSVPPRCTFIQFADATTDIAHELYGDEGAKIVRDAWNEVGVVRQR
ncbi:metalloprotease [Lasiosphaeria miniovina]|uniref:Metalloprotease n=1 Tax=Lasiosphaeria miniovina TaxID=1954250 RepID=A0AA40A6J0_9PEZI|nr:metalloprotease [Lasiosphaeria miniovina]KAK0710142.1 metalloprotease [Lasiosphaeria miniovina]